jgi:hypothetical protein
LGANWSLSFQICCVYGRGRINNTNLRGLPANARLPPPID